MDSVEPFPRTDRRHKFSCVKIIPRIEGAKVRCINGHALRLGILLPINVDIAGQRSTAHTIAQACLQAIGPMVGIKDVHVGIRATCYVGGTYRFVCITCLVVVSGDMDDEVIPPFSS